MITCVTGPDGAGKTTYLRKLVVQAAGRLGYMPQKFGLYENLSVAENLKLYADLHGVRRGDFAARAERLLAATNLLRFKSRMAGKLSGGMKQKLALACALVSEPDTLILDEPTVGVDVVSRRELWAILKSFIEGREMEVFVSTTYADEEYYCDKVIRLGGVLAPAPIPPRTAGPLEGDDAIVAESLVKRFGDFTAVNDISFTVGRGEIFGLLGANGAGKTTTFRMLCGLDAPTGGRVAIRGVDLRNAPGEARGRIGFVAQKFSLYGDLSLAENLSFFGGAYGLSGARLTKRLDWAAAEFGLSRWWRTAAGTLPLGVKQRLAMAAALLHEPNVLFLDEATSGADPATRQGFWTRIRALADKGVAVVITTHYLDEAEFCDRMIIMQDGCAVAQGSPADIRAAGRSDNLEEAFVTLIRRKEAKP